MLLADKCKSLGTYYRYQLLCVFFTPIPLSGYDVKRRFGQNALYGILFFWREYVFKIGTGYPACSKTRALRNQFQFVTQTFSWCHRSIRACLISLDRTRMKVCCAQSQRPPSPASLLRRRLVPSRWSGCQSTQNVSNNTLNEIKYRICHICVNCVRLCEKIGQNFEMSRYMWRKYKQTSQKWARLYMCSSHREESRKVPLTQAERAKAYRERKRMRALGQPLDWSFRTWTPTPRLWFYCAETSTWTLCKTNHLWTL
jgi:hypothetical protein